MSLSDLASDTLMPRDCTTTLEAWKPSKLWPWSSSSRPSFSASECIWTTHRRECFTCPNLANLKLKRWRIEQVLGWGEIYECLCINVLHVCSYVIRTYVRSQVLRRCTCVCVTFWYYVPSFPSYACTTVQLQSQQDVSKTRMKVRCTLCMLLHTYGCFKELAQSQIPNYATVAVWFGPSMAILLLILLRARQLNTIHTYLCSVLSALRTLF